jgi:hypothetical protein
MHFSFSLLKNHHARRQSQGLCCFTALHLCCSPRVKLPNQVHFLNAYDPAPLPNEWLGLCLCEQTIADPCSDFCLISVEIIDSKFLFHGELLLSSCF